MKLFYFTAFLFLFVSGIFSANAQDLIILRDGNTIEARVLEITPAEIRYKRFDHLDGPTYTILAVSVLSIRFENGRTEIINAPPQPVSITPSDTTRQADTQEENIFNSNTRFNTLGLSLGYLGVSNIGFSFNGTVSPGPYTFFDFNLGLGFSNFSLNANAGFNGFVPFNKGGWYGGLGIGGGMYELFDTMYGYFAVNAGTGLILFNWLYISAVLQIEVIPEFDIRFKPMVGYIYRFGSPVDTDEEQAREPIPPRERREPRELLRKNWISFEGGYLGSGFRYERHINAYFSWGITHFQNINFFDDNESMVITGLITTRYYPGGLPFYFEFAIGGYFGWYWDPIVTIGEGELGGLGFMINPAIGVRFGGRERSFFVNPFISAPIGFGNSFMTKYNEETEEYVTENAGIGTFIQLRVGIGFGFAW